MNKSKSKLVSKSNSCSPTSTSSSSSSCDEESPELLPQNLVYKYPVAAKTIISGKRRPVMGITALMLNNYKQQQQASVSNGFTTTWPNVYLLGLPIVFNTQHIEPPTTTNRKTKSSRRSVDANNNNMDSDNGFRLEIYGENINESIRI